MIKKTLTFSSLILAALTSNAQEVSHPNIILFLVDDMGWQDTSVPFYNNQQTALNQRFHTPNMERLAQMGVRFTEAYACAISSPTRCSLMSGMNASRHRVTNWTLEKDQKTDATSSTIALPDWNYNGIQPSNTAGLINNSTPITSLPKILKDNGYFTIHCGKAHFGARNTPGGDPATMGFDINIGGGPNGAPGSYLGTKNFGEGTRFAVHGLEKYHGQDIFLTEALTREAIANIKRATEMGKPFYLYMSHYAVHSPYDDDKRFSNNYRGRYDIQLNDTLNEKEARYAALVEGMDKSLGDLLDYLEENPETGENTIILFMSDNGGQGLNNVRQGRANRDQNYPARAGKGSAFMGGVHEPMIVYWPGITKGGTQNNQRIMIEDFFPTILDMAGINKYTTIQTIDGISFIDMIKSPELRRERPIVWHFPNLWGETQNIEEGYGAYSAILKDDYHLIYSWETGRNRLYNIQKDIAEQTDLSAQMPEKVQELSQLLTQYLKERKAQRPTLLSSGKLLPYPDGSEN
ncbi:sulfatase [Bacteroides sp. ET71]|uniref:sulfatase n=1 Tax=Bacteroides sp. ET71 TaxID=2939421 RepID=UPI0020121BC6|nr:sulfatase [Bacteroides sp. ET71]MCL1616828.1 sulfatase [Bacteroides sp. ET71]